MDVYQSKSFYKKYARPSLGSFLESFKADISYFKAENCSLYYQDGDEEIEVIDATSGFGSAFFGHNNPTLKERIIEDLNNNVPFVVQGSIRQKSAELCKKLNDMLNKRTNRSYVSILCSTGSEAVETALKVGCYKDSKKKSDFISKHSKKVFKINERIKRENVQLDSTFVDFLKEECAAQGTEPVRELLALFEARVNEIINQPPVALSLTRGYHGKSTGALQLTHSESFRGEFKAFGIRSIFVDPMNDNDLERAIELSTLEIPTLMLSDGVLKTETNHWVNVATMIVEPIQGEGGIHIISEAFLKKARTLSLKHEFILVCDEIQTGVGRTGRFLCSEKYDMYFDVYLIGKSLGGGLTKISSVCIDHEAYDEGFDVIHTTTFSEDDLSSSVAIEALNIIESGDVLKQAQSKGQFILEELKGLQSEFPNVIKEIRGAGLLLGIEMATQETSSSNVIYNLSINKMLGKMIASYVLYRHKIRIAAAVSDGNIIRVQPAVTISKAQIALVLKALKDAFELIAKADAGNLIAHIIANEKYQVEGRNDYSKHNKWLPESEVSNIKKKITFIATASSSQDIVDIDPSLARFTEDETDVLVDILSGMNIPVRIPGRIIESESGEKAVFYLVSVPYTPKMISSLYVTRSLNKVKESITALVEDAISKGHSTLGLGSFTSILTNNGTDLKTDKISITTGNSLTVVSSAEATFRAAKEKGFSEGEFRLGIIGATGNIGSMYATYASSVCSKMVLIGRDGSSNRLERVANQVYRNALDNPDSCNALYGELKEKLSESKLSAFSATDDDLLYAFINGELGDEAPITISTSTDSAAKCNIVICTSNSTKKILFPEMLGTHTTIISDVSFPPDVHNTVSDMDNVTVLHGGNVDISSVFSDRFRGIKALEKSEAYACMSETILLGLSGTKEHFSYGKLDIEKLYEIKQKASKFGFVIDKPKKVTNVFGSAGKAS